MTKQVGVLVGGLVAVLVVCLAGPAAVAGPIPPVGPGDLVINEIMANPAVVSDSYGEWFELFNRTAFDLDLNGFWIGDDDSDTHTINNGGPLVIAAGGFLLLGIEDDTALNGNVPVAYQYADFHLGNSSDEVVLRAPSGLLIDRAVYTVATSSRSFEIVGCPDAASNDNDPAAPWHLAEHPWPGSSGDNGTPGTWNELQTAGTCVPLPGAALGGIACLSLLALVRVARRRRG